MSIHALLLTSLATALALGLMAPPSLAQSRDQARAAPAKKATLQGVSGPIKIAPIQVEACAAVDASGRCFAVPPDRVLADHGAAYDPQGNPVDRYGYVIAAPGGRDVREVYVSLDR